MGRTLWSGQDPGVAREHRPVDFKPPDFDLGLLRVGELCPPSIDGRHPLRWLQLRWCPSGGQSRYFVAEDTRHDGD